MPEGKRLVTLVALLVGSAAVLVAVPVQAQAAPTATPVSLFCPCWRDMPNTPEAWDRAARLHAIVVANPRDLLVVNARLHQANPAARTLAYQPGPYVPRDTDVYTTAMREHPDYFARDANGNLVGVPKFPNMVLMDPANPGWRALHAQQAVDSAATADGVFVDSMGAAPTVGDPWVTAKPINAATARPYTAGEWLALMKQQLDEIKAAVGTKPVFFNGLGTGANYQSNTKLLATSAADGAMSESFVRGANDKVGQYPTVAAWKANLDMTIDMAAKGKTLLAWSKLWTTATAQQQAAWGTFTLATYLLGVNSARPAAYNFLAADGVERAAQFYANQQARLGNPKGNFTVAGGTYTRRFDGGTVTVKPASKTATIKLNAAPPPGPPLVVARTHPTPINAARWLNSWTTVSWLVTDPRGTIASNGCHPVTVSAEAAPRVIGTCVVTNASGTTTVPVTAGIDHTPPDAAADTTGLVSGAAWSGTITDTQSRPALIWVHFIGADAAHTYITEPTLTCADATATSCTWTTRPPAPGTFRIVARPADRSELSRDIVLADAATIT